MFGKNPLRSKETRTDALAVESVFYTLQGEGPFSGMPCLFIRLSGCNLACTFCDTEFEAQVENYVCLDSLMHRVLAFPDVQRKLVVLTGGEPLRQNISRLVDSLLSTGTDTVQVETAGTLWQEGLQPALGSDRLVLVCSPKTPKVHAKIMQWCKHWKYVVSDGDADPLDGLPIRGTQASTSGQHTPVYRAEVGTVWVSPRDDYDPEKNKRNVAHARDLCLQHGYRLSLQVHKIVGVE